MSIDPYLTVEIWRYDGSLPGKLWSAAFDTVCEFFKQEIDGDCGVPVTPFAGSQRLKPLAI
jgi:hypothetical protein